MAIHTSSKFDRKYKKLPRNIKVKSETKEKIFKNNPFDPRLDTHKLHGKDKMCWSFSIDNIYRIKFIFLKENQILYLDVGTHDGVY